MASPQLRATALGIASCFSLASFYPAFALGTPRVLLPRRCRAPAGHEPVHVGGSSRGKKDKNPNLEHRQINKNVFISFFKTKLFKISAFFIRQIWRRDLSLYPPMPKQP